MHLSRSIEAVRLSGPEVSPVNRLRAHTGVQRPKTTVAVHTLARSAMPTAQQHLLEVWPQRRLVLLKQVGEVGNENQSALDHLHVGADTAQRKCMGRMPTCIIHTTLGVAGNVHLVVSNKDTVR